MISFKNRLIHSFIGSFSLNFSKMSELKGSMDGVSSNSSVVIYLVVGTAGMLILAGGIIFFVLSYQRRVLRHKLEMQQMDFSYQKLLLEATVESQEKERRRVASELHDGVGAMLSAVKLNLNLLQSTLNGNREAITETKKMLDETIENVRRISKALLPAGLEKVGLAPTLSELCQKLDLAGQLSIHFDCTGDIQRFVIEKELMVFRIAQELVNNAIKHAQAANIWVSLDWTHDQVKLSVEDDGKGIDLQALEAKSGIERGIGLYNIENRASLLHSKLQFEQREPKGTSISMTLNLNETTVGQA